MWRKGTFCTVSGNVTWYSIYTTVWKLLKELKVELSCDSAVTLLGIYQKEMKSLS